MTAQPGSFTVTAGGACAAPHADRPDPQLIQQPDIFRSERARINTRRWRNCIARSYGEPGARLPQPGDKDPAIANTVGLALSGGGIRSATISLGVLHALSRAGLVPYVDYISSVSGGSYVASYLCSRFVPTKWRGDVEFDRDADPQISGDDIFAGINGEEGLNHLRQSGRHLLPGGAGDWLKLAALMVRSWLAIHIVIGVTLVTCLLLLKIPQGLWDAFALDWEEKLAVAGLPPDLWPSMWMHGYPVSHWFIASWILPIAALPLVVALALFWTYFFTRGQPRPHDGRLWRAVKGPGFLGAVLIAGLATWLSTTAQAPIDTGARPAAARAVAAIVAIVTVIALIGYLAAETSEWRGARATKRPDTDRTAPKPGSAFARVQEDRVRTLLTNWAKWWLLQALAIAALGLVDSLATTLVLRGRELSYPLKAGAGLAVLVPIARQLILRVGQKGEATGEIAKVFARFGHLIALVVGLFFAVVVGTFWAIVAHRIAWFHAPVGMVERSLWFGPWTGLCLTIVVFAILSTLIAVGFSFLNLSSFAGFYASNLRRAYLGASNTNRWCEERWSVNRDHVDDDIALNAYYDPRLRPPLHLINCTINDTASHASNLTQRDRRGKPLVISPAGYLFPQDNLRGTLQAIPLDSGGAGGDSLRQRMRERIQRIKKWGKPFTGGDKEIARATPEQLPLSTWIGISGAAASTGVGQYGSLGLSLLAGLSAVRLGYWWKPGLARGKTTSRFAQSVQARLRDEFFSHFTGSEGDRWYLTDGGHFENTGAYELIRRRVGLIVVLDNGSDPGYEFADLATLARRVRIDFDAELSFDTTAGDLDRLFGADNRRVANPLRRAFAPIRDLGLVAGKTDPSYGPYAAIGRVTYRDSAPEGVEKTRRVSTVIWIKPRVCGAEASDLLAYARSHPPFPQESTLDQNFSEPQWESYYRLGMIMGGRLFASATEGSWNPASLRSFEPQHATP